MNARQVPGWRVLLDRLHQSQHHRCSRSCCVIPLSFLLMPSRAVRPGAAQKARAWACVAALT